MYLIVGAGFLGTYLISRLSQVSAEPIVGAVRRLSDTLPCPNTTYVQCDVTNPDDIARLCALCGNEKLTVFYFAARHNVDELFEHAQAGRIVNIDALSYFLDTVPGINKFFFASTDCVYGENAPGSRKFRESDPCRPINIYGEQKLEAEGIVKAHGFTSVRFSYMLGASLLHKRHFYDRITEKLRAGETVEMIDGMVRSAITYETAAGLLAQLAMLPAEKQVDVVNLCSDGEYSKYELGLCIAARVGADRTQIRKLSEAEGRKFFSDRRAERLVMDNRRLKKLLGLREILLEV